jgi:hypothetical protein
MPAGWLSAVDPASGRTYYVHTAVRRTWGWGVGGVRGGT